MEVSSSKKRKPWPKDQFTDLVLSLSLGEIFDENLYKYQVEKIPQLFESVDQYLLSYVFPLLEETRASLASALETVYKAPFAEVSNLTESKSDELMYNVKIDQWRNRVSERGKDPYRTLPGDFVMLTNMKPETASDLQRFGWTYTFATIQYIDEDLDGDSCTITDFKIKASKYIDVEDVLQKSLYVVFLTNITTNKRIWNALNKRGNLNIIENILSKDSLVQRDCEICTHKSNIDMGAKFGAKLLCSLNESQNRAISASLNLLECHHKSSVELIWGPPGTGKTRTVSVLLYILLKVNVRTLICAPTNVAITELASRLVKLVRDSSSTECEEGILPCPLGDILIFGNKDNLKVGSDIEEVFLDYRVDRLVNCLGRLTGWKHCIVSMIDFLENCATQYGVFVDNEKIAAEESLEDEIRKSKPKSFLEFTRERFKNTTFPLRRSMVTLLTHVPRRSILDQIFQSMRKILSLLNSFERVLFDENMKCEELEKAFSREQIDCGPESLGDSGFLLPLRTQCLSTLRSLQSSPPTDLPHNISKATAKEYCFKKASLIFCTTSTSFKLHSMDMEPLELLVIDEAAQVKECESVIPLQVPLVRHAILVGDEWQLPATVNSKLSEEAGFGRSLFERLSSLSHFKHLLDMQYRMHPSISCFPNSNFYHNQIVDAPNVQHVSYGKCYIQGKMFGPYSFINIPGGEEELDDVGRSKRNMVEVAVVVKLVQKLYKGWNGSKAKLSIGVISPYAAQVVAIQDKLKHMFENLERFTIKVKSIDGFQGGEEDIIIISTVRSNKGGSIGFLSSPQRTNVALTRARYCLWILGNAMTLSRSDSVWEALVNDAKYRQCFFDAGEDSDIAKTVIEIKKELDQLEDMLNADSILFKNARWKVLFSDNFRKSFGILRRSHLKKLVINLLLKLASGWRPKKVNVDSTCESSSHIVKQFKVEGYYVVCSVDIIKEEFRFYKQVLKVWDVLPVAGIPKLLKRLDMIFDMHTDEFTNHCKEKCLEGNLEVPKSWSVSKDIIRFKNPNTAESSSDASSSADCKGYVENSRVSESLLLMKFYSLSTSAVKHLLSDHEGRELDLPFEVTDEERETIIFPRTSFILGRSGTGKTTVLTMKLYRTLQQYCFASGESVSSNKIMCTSKKIDVSDDGTNLHQLFVTVSPKLCYAVKHHVTQLKRFATGDVTAYANLSEMDDIDDIIEFKDIPDTFVGIQPQKYPLIITFHKFIMMLDGTLGNSYFERFRDVRASFKSEASTLRSVALQTFIRKNEVTYDRFASFYWPHLNSRLTKNLEPSRVFTEIMSHIKGGLREGETCDTKRSREEYVSLAESRVFSTINAEKREVIYDIYLDYEKMKIERGEFDLADLVIDIHVRLSNENLLGDKMDFVYIDEVQDLTMRQIALFRYICTNVDEGFVFSGDTAQTIARGIDFRFEDIRSLFYNEFLMRSKNCLSGGRREKGHISDTFHLSHNFRTHIGVLRLAQSVIDIICHFFPQSIDKLAPETSLIYGEPPVLLEPGSDENAIVTIFGNSSSAAGKWIGFGAEQVILVRDDSARKEISKYIGNRAIVLTIVECKGLEFQDVLLYNFFGSSPMSNQWRVLYEFLKERDLLDDISPESFPNFDESRHTIMCSELKQLYVAITRTRQRLWICEKNEDVSKPMFDYWRRLCLVQVRKVDDSIAEAMQRASSPEEWRAQGIKLFWEKNYEMATMCFEKAGDEIWEKRAKASGLRETADRLRDTNSAEARVMLTGAAEIFESIGKADIAAECFCDMEEYERAGRIYLEKCGMSELGKAGECFTLAGNYKTAAEVYCKGGLLTECLSACTKGKNFEMGLQYIENWKQQAAWDSRLKTKFNEIDRIAQDFLYSCAHECHRTKDNASMLKFVRAFQTMDSKRDFLRSLDCLEELLTIEDESGNFDEAAKIAKLIGNVLLEADLLGKGEKYLEASSVILSYVLSNSLWTSSREGWPLKWFHRKDELLNKAKSFAKKVSGSFFDLISNDAEILSHAKRSLFELMQSYISSKQCKSHISEILSVKKLLDAQLQIHPSKYEWEHELPSNPTTYFEEKMLGNRISLRTLVCAWSLHKENILKILECLDSLGSQEENAKCESVVEFCLKYFGVRFSDNLSGTYQLMNPTAEWVKNVQKFLRKNRKVSSLDTRHFVSAAQKYFQKELLSDGLKVLETLQALHKDCEMKGLSLYCQSTCLTSIYDITKFFMKSDSPKKLEDKKLEDFMQLSMKYFEYVFPLDPRRSLSENMIALRESENSKNLLQEFMSRNLDTKNVLTHGQIGRAVMTWLGSGKPRRDLYEKMIEKFGIEKFGENSSWKSFIELLWSNSAKESLVLNQHFLSQEFRIALERTYSANWRVRDYISPNCFLYLVERLLILVPHYRGFFYTTKSAFMEFLICNEMDSANPSAGLVSEERFTVKNIFDFIASVIQQFLFNFHDTVQWIESYGVNNGRYYYPVLILRLVMIQCLLCLTSEIPFHSLIQLLGRVGSKLPLPFCEAIRCRKNNNSGLDSVSKAFKIIGDPVVIIALKENKFKFTCPDAIFLDMKLFSYKKDIMDILFPKSAEAKARPTSVETNVTESSVIEVPHFGNNQGDGTKLKAGSNLSLDNGKEILHKIWEFLQSVSGVFESEGRDYGGDPSALILTMKAEVKNLVMVLVAAVGQFTELRSDEYEDESTLSEATNMIEELKQFDYFLDRSDSDGKHMGEIAGPLKKLLSRRPQFDAFYDLFAKKKDASGSDASSGTNGVEVSRSNHGSGETSTTNDSSVAERGQGKGKAVAENKQSKQDNEGGGQGKGKGKNKNKGGKGKKKKR